MASDKKLVENFEQGSEGYYDIKLFGEKPKNDKERYFILDYNKKIAAFLALYAQAYSNEAAEFIVSQLKSKPITEWSMFPATNIHNIFLDLQRDPNFLKIKSAEALKVNLMFLESKNEEIVRIRRTLQDLFSISDQQLNLFINYIKRLIVELPAIYKMKEEVRKLQIEIDTKLNAIRIGSES
jgi:hypothetical protein